MNKETRIITAALPFVNNLPHLGNIAGSHLPADIFARHSRKLGHRVYLIGGSDEHGTATELAAHRSGLGPREICDEYHALHRAIYQWFGISYDLYSRTSGDAHKRCVREFFLRLHERGLIKRGEIRVARCESCGRGLADRLLRGTCPRCGSREATGDQCESCDAALEAEELIDPRCVFCEKESVKLELSEHLFFDINPLVPRISEWLESNARLAPRLRAEALGWIGKGVKPRCITRRLEWGIQVPLAGFEDKVIYVWFENLIGYVSILRELLGAQGDELWRDPETRVYHFLGKDNVVFHTLYWPGELLGDGRYILPHDVIGLQHLNYEGLKFSKSKGVGIFCDAAARSGIPADYWRFYLASALPESKDSEFVLADFHARIDSLLIGVLGNLIHRTLTLIWRQSDGLAKPIQRQDPAFEAEISALEDKVLASFEACRFRDALGAALDIARAGNRYLAETRPWSTGNSDGLAYALRCARSSARALEPIIPEHSRKALELLGGAAWHGGSEEKLGKPEPLFRKAASFESMGIS